MPSMAPTQAEADALIVARKWVVNAAQIVLPARGDHIGFELGSPDADETFMLDIRRAHGSVEKGTIQLRVRTSVVLVRLDYNGPRHKNPDSNWVSGTHLHVYREGFADRWADPPLREHFRDTNIVATMLTDFLTYCRIQIAPSTETMGARC